jgi:hypothetical protein
MIEGMFHRLSVYSVCPNRVNRKSDTVNLGIIVSHVHVTSRQGRSPDLGYVNFRMTKH